ncbi:MAG: glycerol kinase GlpK [Clostridia bacterium]|nr:glycerol kinase GlpK [Clostridia bacterium]
MKKYVISLDEGTTSARAMIFDRNQNPLGCARREITQHYPAPGWVEQDATEIFASQYGAMTEVMALCSASPEEIAAIGITNQRETTVVWDRDTGRPIAPAIVWQCRRTADACAALAKSPLGAYITEVTGLVPDAYFSATKLAWILDNIEGARERAERGELAFGTIDSWLIWKLTGGAVHATDYTNAARTMLFNIRTLEWDDRILSEMNIPRSLLPEVKASGSSYGSVNVGGYEIPILGVAGDQHAALFGQSCFSEGDAKNTYGTGCFLLMNTGETFVKSNHGLLTTLASTLEGEPIQYVLEGSVFTGGALVQWLRDELGIIRDSADCEYFARKVEDTAGVYIVPAFTGLGAPYWDMYARGSIIGITRGTNRSHLIRAALEAIALQSEDVISAMRADTGHDMSCLRADGGASANALLMQMQADFSNLEVRLPHTGETTALGAARLAGLMCGFWADRNELRGVEARCQADYKPIMTKAEREHKLAGWHEAIGRTLTN